MWHYIYSCLDANCSNWQTMFAQLNVSVLVGIWNPTDPFVQVPVVKAIDEIPFKLWECWIRLTARSLDKNAIAQQVTDDLVNSLFLLRVVAGEMLFLQMTVTVNRLLNKLPWFQTSCCSFCTVFVKVCTQFAPHGLSVGQVGCLVQEDHFH